MENRIFNNIGKKVRQAALGGALAFAPMTAASQDTIANTPKMEVDDFKKIEVEELDFAKHTDFKMPADYLREINFIGGLYDGIAIAPDSSGSYSVIFSKINNEELVLKHVSKKIIDDFLSVASGKEETMNIADENDPKKLKEIETVVYMSDKFVGKFIPDGYDLKKFKEECIVSLDLSVRATLIKSKK